jgi:hypothetical protein
MDSIKRSEMKKEVQTPLLFCTSYKTSISSQNSKFEGLSAQHRYVEGGKEGDMDHVSQRKKKPFHDSRVLKKQFQGKLDSHKII